MYVVRKDGQPFTEAEFWTLFETMVRLADRLTQGPVTEAIFTNYAQRLKDQMARPLLERALSDFEDEAQAEEAAEPCAVITAAAHVTKGAAQTAKGVAGR